MFLFERPLKQHNVHFTTIFQLQLCLC